MEKTFKKRPAEIFISAADQTEGEHKNKDERTPAPTEKELNIPKGYRLAPELKNKRVQLLVKASTKETIQKLATAKGFSMNEFINMILEEYIERN